MFAFAADTTIQAWFGTSGIFQTIVGGLVPIVTTLAIVYFIWGVIEYITASGDAEKEKEGRGRIIYGLLGVLVIFSLYGIINLLQSTFSITGSNALTVPTLK
jgi:hypothetical protein